MKWLNALFPTAGVTSAGGFYLFLSPPASDSYVSSPDPFKPFIIFSNRHEIRRIDLNKGEFSVLVPGLRNTIALDFHLNQSALYWTDVVEDKIYRGKLSENGGECWGKRPIWLLTSSSKLYINLYFAMATGTKVHNESTGLVERGDEEDIEHII